MKIIHIGVVVVSGIAALFVLGCGPTGSGDDLPTQRIAFDEVILDQQGQAICEVTQDAATDWHGAYSIRVAGKGDRGTVTATAWFPGVDGLPNAGTYSLPDDAAVWISTDFAGSGGATEGWVRVSHISDLAYVDFVARGSTGTVDVIASCGLLANAPQPTPPDEPDPPAPPTADYTGQWSLNMRRLTATGENCNDLVQSYAATASITQRSDGTVTVALADPNPSVEGDVTLTGSTEGDLMRATGERLVEYTEDQNGLMVDQKFDFTWVLDLDGLSEDGTRADSQLNLTIEDLVDGGDCNYIMTSNGASQATQQ